MSASVSGKNSDGTSIFSTVVSATNPGLSATGWATYQTAFQLPEIWDGSGNLRLDIKFILTGETGGKIYTGYLDNVVLQQIPEPSPVALFSLGLLWLVALNAKCGRNLNA